MIQDRKACAAAWLGRLHAAAARLGRPVRFMEVCGTHTVSAFRCGLRSVMPANVGLLSGPGCPVCVTSAGDVAQIVSLARRGDVTVCTYGDMVKVTGPEGSLELARSEGADVRVIYSALQAVELARELRPRSVVFAAVGFETTAPATAAAILAAEEGRVENFGVLASHKLVVPAMRALLDSGAARVDGFLCPGHVAVVTGSEAFRCVVTDYRLPCVVGGFEAHHILAALARLTECAASGEAVLENQYPGVVGTGGNRVAQMLTGRVFEGADVGWRGLGRVRASGLAIRPEYSRFDARARFDLSEVDRPEPAGCRCGEVITGRCDPPDCPLFARACTPTDAVGPCMVSSEGSCQAWFRYRRSPVTRHPGDAARSHGPLRREEAV